MTEGVKIRSRISLLKNNLKRMKRIGMDNMSDKIYTVDRIEEDIAVLTRYDDAGDEHEYNILLDYLPENLKESDMLRFNTETNTYSVDKAKTEQTKSDLEERLRKLFKK